MSNFVLRWIWVITIIPFSFEQEAGEWGDGTRGPQLPSFWDALMDYDRIIIPVLGGLELLRRFQWGVLRG